MDLKCASQFFSAVRAKAVTGIKSGAAMGAYLKGHILAHRAQMFLPDFRISALLIFCAYYRVKLIQAAAAGRFDIIPYIPFEDGYEEYMKIRIGFTYLKSGKGFTGRAYYIVGHA